jgi:hypothetical protein
MICIRVDATKIDKNFLILHIAEAQKYLKIPIFCRAKNIRKFIRFVKAQKIDLGIIRDAQLT